MKIGDRVWWWHTWTHKRHGTIVEAEFDETDLSMRYGVETDDGDGVIYLSRPQLNPL